MFIEGYDPLRNVLGVQFTGSHDPGWLNLWSNWNSMMQKWNSLILNWEASLPHHLNSCLPSLTGVSTIRTVVFALFPLALIIQRGISKTTRSCSTQPHTYSKCGGSFLLNIMQWQVIANTRHIFHLSIRIQKILGVFWCQIMLPEAL
jgi:hypothetical protein